MINSIHDIVTTHSIIEHPEVYIEKNENPPPLVNCYDKMTLDFWTEKPEHLRVTETRIIRKD